MDSHWMHYSVMLTSLITVCVQLHECEPSLGGDVSKKHLFWVSQSMYCQIYFSNFPVLWNERSFGSDLFSSFTFIAERRWEPFYERFFQHPWLFALQHDINTSEASLYHMLHKTRAKGSRCPEGFTHGEKDYCSLCYKGRSLVRENISLIPNCSVYT